MPDIRSFFQPKGGGAPAAKPAPKEEDKKGRGKARKVVDDSEEDEVIEIKKPAVKAAPKKKSDPNAVKGVETSASSYFGTTQTPAKKPSSAAKNAKNKSHPGVEIRMSPRTKSPASRPTPDSKPTNGVKKKAVTAYPKYDDDGDFMDHDDEDADDIFAADVKSRKRKSDDYEEDESVEEIMPKAKRAAPRKKAAVKDDSDDEVVITAVSKKTKSSVAKKRKSPSYDEDDEEAEAEPRKKAAPAKKRKKPSHDEDDEEEEAKPRKKAAPAKKRAPRAKKEAEPEPEEIQSILANVPTVEAPDAPPKEETGKFEWAKGPGNAGPAPMEGALEIPDGAENCLIGKSFVFTGLLKTIARERAQELVKQYGGKVTTAPSSKTDFVVLGDDAGPSKLRKIKEHNIKTIDEAGLFYLIKTMPANGGAGPNAEKAKKKQEDEAEKARVLAAELEKEEKARRAEALEAQKQASARGAVSLAPKQLAQLWTNKYAPTQLSHICGNKSNVEKIQAFLKNWQKNKRQDFKKRGPDGLGAYRAIIISGPPGIGKTTAAHLAAKLEGYDVLESNASDARNKKLVENGVSQVINNTSLLGYFAGDGKKVDKGKMNLVLIMDEVDGMSSGDRGGVGALAQFCKKTEVPLILICNDRRLPKMKPFEHVAFDIKFQRPQVDQIRSRMMTICHREGLKLPVNVVNSLIEGSNKDIRQVINMLSSARFDQETMDFAQSKDMAKSWEKHVILKPWDICQKMLAGGLFAPTSKATLNDKIELYFNDHELSCLMIQDNYLSTKPMTLTAHKYTPREYKLKHLELVDEAAESISDGDLVDRMIHGPQQHWSLMPTHAVFSTVRPASRVAGQLLGGSMFPSWLGKNSKGGKLGRFVREIHSHMRLKSSGDHNEVRQQYLPALWYRLVKRLEMEGKECIDDVINLMDSYYLTRDDFDAIQELGVGPQSEGNVKIETQTKAAFTRTYNLKSHPIPFMKASSVSAPKKLSKNVPDLEEAIEEDDDVDVMAEPVEADDEEADIKADKYIKQPKAKAKAGAKKTGAKKGAKDADDGDDDDGEVKPKAKAKAKPQAKARSRAAKK